MLFKLMWPGLSGLSWGWEGVWRNRTGQEVQGTHSQHSHWPGSRVEVRKLFFTANRYELSLLTCIIIRKKILIFEVKIVIVNILKSNKQRTIPYVRKKIWREQLTASWTISWSLATLRQLLPVSDTPVRWKARNFKKRRHFEVKMRHPD